MVVYSYLVSIVSDTSLAAMKQYIENQKISNVVTSAALPQAQCELACSWQFCLRAVLSQRLRLQKAEAEQRLSTAETQIFCKRPHCSPARQD